MCDFRCITKIRLLGPRDWDDADPIVVDTLDCLNMSKEEAEKTGKLGLYNIPGSGSYHAYWTGERWLYEGEGWEVVNQKY